MVRPMRSSSVKAACLPPLPDTGIGPSTAIHIKSLICTIPRSVVSSWYSQWRSRSTKCSPLVYLFPLAISVNSMSAWYRVRVQPHLLPVQRNNLSVERCREIPNQTFLLLACSSILPFETSKRFVKNKKARVLCADHRHRLHPATALRLLYAYPVLSTSHLLCVQHESFNFNKYTFIRGFLNY